MIVVTCHSNRICDSHTYSLKKKILASWSANSSRRVYMCLLFLICRFSRMIGGNDILCKVMVLYGNIWEKITGSVAELEHSRRMLSHARRVYLEAYVCTRTKIRWRYWQTRSSQMRILSIYGSITLAYVRLTSRYSHARMNRQGRHV